MANKKFKDLQPGEKLFILRPFTFQIHQAEIKHSVIHPKTKNGKVWVLGFYIPFKNEKITTDALKIAEKHFTKTTTQVFVNKDESWAVIMIKPAPTMIATTKEEIEAWLKTATPGDITEYLRMKKL